MRLWLVAAAAAQDLFLEPAAPADFQATVRADKEPTAFPHFWQRCIGSGHMLLGTRQDWRQHLKLARDELGIQQIRGHGIFDDDMSVVPEKGAGYEFYNVDQVFDYLVELGMRPIVELSFMPSALVSCGGKQQPACTYAFNNHAGYKGLIMPPDDFEDWHDMVVALSQHLVERYGLKEVQQWHFEVWNEMWGVTFPEPYMSLYNASAIALKSVHPSLRVGGPATMQTLDVAGFINATRTMGLPVDFVSTHFYPTDPQCLTAGTKSDQDCFAHTVLAAQQLAEEIKKPFFLTEYNNGLGSSSRDDSSAAAFIFRNVGMLTKLDLFSWWTFSDVFEEQWMRSDPFHNGFGLMTVQGTRKPAWRAFELLASAGSQRLEVSGNVSPVEGNSSVSVLALKGDGPGLGLQLFVANFKRVEDVVHFKCNRTTQQCAQDPDGTYTDESLCSANCAAGVAQAAPAPTLATTVTHAADPAPAPTLAITITHAADAAPATATARWMDKGRSNPQAAWIQMGSPRYPNATQLAALDEASQLVSESVVVSRVSSTQSVVRLEVPLFSAVRVDL